MGNFASCVTVRRINFVGTFTGRRVKVSSVAEDLRRSIKLCPASVVALSSGIQTLTE
jgi:hypothetical protein